MNGKKVTTTDWPTYTENLQKILQDMLMKNELADVTLVCDDQRQFKAHKVVLSACSAVFKNILNDHLQNSSIIYLTGIQHEEMKSILEFMYCGATNLHQHRKNDFLNVAQSLEIQGITTKVMSDENVTSNEFDTTENEFESLKSEPENDTEDNGSINDTSIFNCDHCKSQFAGEGYLIKHIQTKHQGVKYVSNGYFVANRQFYQTKHENMFLRKQIEVQGKSHACNKCDKKYGTASHLKDHVLAKHTSVRYDCNYCDYKASYQNGLKKHIQSIHEGVKFKCDHCDYKASQKGNLKHHIEVIHEGVRYYCNQCDYQIGQKHSLKKHIQSKHVSVYF